MRVRPRIPTAMEERPNNSRSVPGSRRSLPLDDIGDMAGGSSSQTGFVRNLFSTGGAQASVDSTSSDGSDCSSALAAGTSAEGPGSASATAAAPPAAAA